jgi:hypothetical protein
VIPRVAVRDRRALVTGTIVILLLLLQTRWLPAWRRWDGSVRASAAATAQEAARAEHAVLLLPHALDSLQVRRVRLASLARGALAGESAAASAAALASLVSGAAARAGVQIGTVQVRPDTPSAGTFVRIGVRADGTGDLGAITRMLVLLEGGTELLAVRAFSITQPIPGGAAEQPEALQLEIVVEGLALSSRAEIPRANMPAHDEEASLETSSPFVDTLPAPGRAWEAGA